jgi:hypothetical protein
LNLFPTILSGTTESSSLSEELIVITVVGESGTKTGGFVSGGGGEGETDSFTLFFTGDNNEPSLTVVVGLKNSH